MRFGSAIALALLAAACARSDVVVTSTTSATAATSTTQIATVAELRYRPSEGPPGGTITVTGTCRYENQPADRALVSLFKQPPTADFAVHVSIPTGANGAVNGTLQVPDTAAPGPYLLSGLCIVSDFTIGGAITDEFRVVGTPGTTTTSTTVPPPTTPTTVITPGQLVETR